MDKAPDAFRTISEVAAELDVPQHVLRFWETRFSQIRPMKRAGGRRYYRPQDVQLLRGIRHLLYEEGYTIKGVQKILREHGIAHVIAIGKGEIVPGPAGGMLAGAGSANAAVAVNLTAPTEGNTNTIVSPPAAREKPGDGSDASVPAASAGNVEPSVISSPSAGLSEQDRALLKQALAELERAESLLKSIEAEPRKPGQGSEA